MNQMEEGKNLKEIKFCSMKMTFLYKLCTLPYPGKWTSPPQKTKFYELFEK